MKQHPLRKLHRGCCLFCEFCLVPVDLLLVTVSLGEHAAAVFLHVKAQFPGPLVPGPEIGAEVPVEEGDAVLLGIALRRFGDSLVILIGAGQKRGGEGGEAMLRGVFGGAFQPVGVAVGAAVSMSSATCRTNSRSP